MEYPVMADPLLKGAVHVTVAEVELADTLATPINGVAGVVVGVMLLLLTEYELLPTTLMAATVNVYVVP